MSEEKKKVDEPKVVEDKKELTKEEIEERTKREDKCLGKIKDLLEESDCFLDAAITVNSVGNSTQIFVRTK